MDIDLSKKLVFLLRGKQKNNQTINQEELESLINKIKNNLIPTILINYLYNYLYAYCTNSNIAVKFHQNTVVLVEINKTESEKKYNFISPSKIGDIKHLKINLIYDRQRNKVIAIKELHYALDSCVDLVVLSRLDDKEYDSTKNPSDIFNAEYHDDDFTEISFINYEDPTMYEKHSLVEDKNLSNENTKQVKSDLYGRNLTYYTKAALKELMILFKLKNAAINSEIKDIKDAYENEGNIQIEDNDLSEFYSKKSGR